MTRIYRSLEIIVIHHKQQNIELEHFDTSNCISLIILHKATDVEARGQRKLFAMRRAAAFIIDEFFLFQTGRLYIEKESDRHDPRALPSAERLVFIGFSARKQPSGRCLFGHKGGVSGFWEEYCICQTQ